MASHEESVENTGENSSMTTSDTLQTNVPSSARDVQQEEKRDVNAEKQTKVEVLSHAEIIHVVRDTMAGLITTDPLLKDLHPYVTLEEVKSMIALEYGQAMVVNVRRADDDVLVVVVKQEATVLDLKHGIKRFLTLKMSRNAEGSPTINWRYVWKHNWLYFNGEKLTDDNKLLKEYGIRNRDEVMFMKRLQEK